MSHLLSISCSESATASIDMSCIPYIFAVLRDNWYFISLSPVNLIVKYSAINRVGLLTNLKQEELITLQEFLHCIKGDIDLTLIHAHKEQESVNSLEEKLALWLTNIEPFNAVRNVNILTAPIVREDKNLDDIPEVISKIIADNAIDLILITKSRKTFF